MFSKPSKRIVGNPDVSLSIRYTAQYVDDNGDTELRHSVHRGSYLNPK
jgi:hypothetical protein